jgi:hypothetical protein
MHREGKFKKMAHTYSDADLLLVHRDVDFIRRGQGCAAEEVAEAVDARAAACRRSVVVVGGGAAV